MSWADDSRCVGDGGRMRKGMLWIAGSSGLVQREFCDAALKTKLVRHEV